MRGDRKLRFSPALRGSRRREVAAAAIPTRKRFKIRRLIAANFPRSRCSRNSPGSLHVSSSYFSRPVQFFASVRSASDKSLYLSHLCLIKSDRIDLIHRDIPRADPRRGFSKSTRVAEHSEIVVARIYGGRFRRSLFQAVKQVSLLLAFSMITSATLTDTLAGNWFPRMVRAIRRFGAAHPPC